MTHAAPTERWATRGALALALLLPTVVFAALLPQGLEMSAYPPTFAPPERGCGEPRFELPSTCTQPLPTPCIGCTSWSCSVAADWTVSLAMTGLDPDCTHALVVTEKSPNGARDAWSRRASPVACVALGTRRECRLAMPPVRPHYLVVSSTAPDGRVHASSPGLVLVARDGLLDIRPGAIVPSLSICAAAFLIAAAMLMARRRLAARSTWRRTLILRGSLTALGGSAAIVLQSLAPPDVGGFDHAAPERLLWLVPVCAVFGFFTGIAIASMRAEYRVRDGTHRALILLGAIVFALAGTLYLRRSMTENASIGAAFSVKDCYYCGMGIVLAIPALVLPPFRRGGALRIALVTFGAALIMATSAVVIVDAIDLPTHAQLSGFYKPPSAFMHPIAMLPFIAALATAVTLDTDRPPWLARAATLLELGLAPQPAEERLRNVRELGLHLVRHADALAESSPAQVAPLAFFGPLLLGPLLRDRWDRIGLERGMRDVATRLESLLAKLVALRGEAVLPFLETAVRLRGPRVRVHIVPWPAVADAHAPTAVILRDGALDVDLTRLSRVRATLARLVEQLGPGPLRGGGYLVVHTDDDAPAHGPPRAGAPHGDPEHDADLASLLRELWTGVRATPSTPLGTPDRAA